MLEQQTFQITTLVVGMSKRVLQQLPVWRYDMSRQRFEDATFLCWFYADEALGTRDYRHEPYVLGHTSAGEPFLYRPESYDIQFPGHLFIGSGSVEVPHAIVK